MKRTACEKYYDRVAHSYDDSYQTPYWDFYKAVTWHNLKQYLPRLQGRKILDVGGGTGLWALKLAKSGFEVTLADISQKMLDRAWQKAESANLASRIKFVKADICDLNMFGPDTFDMVLAQGDPLSLCGDARPVRSANRHETNQSNLPNHPKVVASNGARKAIKEIHRVTKTKGYFICSTDNKFGAMRVFVSQSKWDELEDFVRTGNSKWFTNDASEQHPIHYFTPEELRKLLTESGFEVLALIGKLVLPISSSNYEMLKDRNTFDRLLAIELKLHAEPALLGSANHIEITGRKI